MTQKSAVPYLKLIKGSVQQSAQTEIAKNEGQISSQSLLFPMVDPALLLFINITNLTSADFVSLLETARPMWLFDVRPTPRFDIDRMNRKLAFELFERNNIKYRDVAALKGVSSRRDAELNPSILAEFIEGIIGSDIQPKGPLAFIFDDDELLTCAVDIFPREIRSKQNQNWQICIL